MNSATSGSGWAHRSSATICAVPAITRKLINVVSNVSRPFWAAATPKPMPKGREASPGRNMRRAPAWKLRRVTRAERDTVSVYLVQIDRPGRGTERALRVAAAVGDIAGAAPAGELVGVPVRAVVAGRVGVAQRQVRSA